jgi:hypothetical protein
MVVNEVYLPASMGPGSRGWVLKDKIGLDGRERKPQLLLNGRKDA